MNFMEGNFPEARDVSDVFFSFDFKDTSTSTSGSASCFSQFHRHNDASELKRWWSVEE